MTFVLLQNPLITANQVLWEVMFFMCILIEQIGILCVCAFVFEETYVPVVSLPSVI